MKKKLIIFCLIIYQISFSQENCNYSVSITSEKIKETGNFKLSIKNIGSHSFKIPKEINFCNMYLVDLEYLNEKTHEYEKMKMAKKDVDCFTYKDKDKNLKPTKTYIYDVNMKNDFDVLQNHKFFETFNDIKYRFKVSFFLESDDKCGDKNKLTTDWIYKN